MAFALTAFPNFYFNLSVCAASRVTFFTGLRASHHGVTGNSLAVNWSNAGGANNAIGVWLQAAGYRTALLGKYLNKVVSDTFVAPGWHEWRAMVDDNQNGAGHEDHGMRYLNFWLSVNGTLSQVTGGDTWTGAGNVGYTTAASDARAAASLSGHQTDWMSRRAQTYLSTATEPFYLDLAAWATHGEGTNGNKPRPATRHAAATFSATHNTSWNEADVTDKPKWLRDTMPSAMTAPQQTFADEYDIETKRSALGIEELLYDVVRKLTDLGMIDRTMILIMADNGAMSGEHRLTFQTAGSVKNVPYEASQHNRLYVHWPSAVPAGGRPNVVVIKVDDMAPHVWDDWTWLQSQVTATNTALLSSVDICPTVMDVARATPTLRPDGMSIVPLLDGRIAAANFRTQVHLEYDPADNSSITELPKFDALASLTEKYVRYSALAADPAEDEHYTLTTDPDEMVNDVGSLTAAQKAALDAKVAGMLAG